MINKYDKLRKRNSNIELLRIISMLLIILSHFSVFSGVDASKLPLGINRFFLEVIKLGNAGVIIFVLITGYYNINKEKCFSLKKIVLLYLQVFFYSITIYLLLWLFGINKFEIKEFIKSFFPITFKQYWFFSVYFMLYFLMPFINIFLNSLDKKAYVNFLLITIGFFIVLRTITTCNYYGNELIYFIVFYCIGGYIRRYRENIFFKYSKFFIIFSTVFLICSVVLFDILGLKYSIFNTKQMYFFDKSNVVMLFLSIGIFCTFIKKKENNSFIINLIGRRVFGVYLIHNNPLLISLLWGKIFNNINYVDSPYLIVYSMFCVVLVFLSCSIIDLIRYYILEKNVIILFHNLIKRCERLIKNIIKRIELLYD